MGTFHGATLQEHLARYCFALPYVKRKRVLDIGCYCGHGAQILDLGALELVGVDNDTVALARCRERRFFAPHGVHFYAADLERATLRDQVFGLGTFGVITMFEVLEHLSDPEFVVKQISDLLDPEGFFIFSVPHMVANHQHKVLFDEQKITELITRHLSLVELHRFDKKPITGRKCYANVVDYVGIAKRK